MPPVRVKTRRSELPGPPVLRGGRMAIPHRLLARRLKHLARRCRREAVESAAGRPQRPRRGTGPGKLLGGRGPKRRRGGSRQACRDMRRPIESTTKPRFQAWLAGLPFLEPDHILDIFYLEQRLGCWAGIMPYGVAEDGQSYVFPLCHREIIELILALPRSYRWDGSLPIDIIRHEWPELLEYPINTPLGIQRAWVAAEHAKTRASREGARFMKAARNPGWAVQKVIERLYAGIR